MLCFKIVQLNQKDHPYIFSTKVTIHILPKIQLEPKEQSQTIGLKYDMLQKRTSPPKGSFIWLYIQGDHPYITQTQFQLRYEKQNQTKTLKGYCDSKRYVQTTTICLLNQRDQAYAEGPLVGGGLGGLQPPSIWQTPDQPPPLQFFGAKLGHLGNEHDKRLPNTSTDRDQPYPLNSNPIGASAMSIDI